MTRLGLELAGEPSVREMMTIARAAEELGYDSIWLTETRFTRDAITAAAAVAAVTERVRVGTAVVNPFTRGAVLNAVTAATLDELAGGRFVFGIGPGSPTVLARQGITFDRPLTRLRETVAAVRALLRGGSVTRDGETFSIAGAALDFAPVRPKIPIYLGVTGPRALDLAGEIADGVILNGFVSLGYTQRAVARVRAAAERAGREPAAIEIAQSIIVSVDDDPARARDALRPLLAIYLSQFPNIAKESDVPAAELARIGALFAAGGPELAATAIGDDLVTALACAGTPTDCRRQITDRRTAGVELPVLSFAHGDFPDALAAILP